MNTTFPEAHFQVTRATATSHRPELELMVARLKYLTPAEFSTWWAELVEANRFVLGDRMPPIRELAR